MGKFDSKRVLQLGSGTLTLQNIKYFKDNGAYVIAADSCSIQDNKYKDLVDEVIQLDINDLDGVIKYCKENNIDACVTNGSEPSFEVARIINEGIGNPFNHTEKQWSTFYKKDNLRKLCIKHNINVPDTYYMGNYTNIDEKTINSIKYPCIIKPVDSGGGIGISVCYKKKELNKAIKYAGKNSASSTIIIEEYVVGKEVVFTYMVQDSIYKLVASSDKYVYKDERNLTVIPDLYIYPSDDHDLYEKEVNQKVIGMLKEQGLNNCTIFFQTIEKDNKFYFFEAGLRFEGTKTYLISDYYTKQNAYNFYYDYLLKTKTDYDITKDDPKLNGHVDVTFIVHLKKGTIRKIKGTKKISENKKIESTYLKWFGYKAGKKPLDRFFAAYSMEGSDRQEVVRKIRFIKETLKVKDFFYRNLIIDSFDESILLQNNK